MTPIVRYLINDVDPTSYTYVDSRIQTSILVAAQLTQNEIDFNKIYTISVADSGLTPDPTTTPADQSFINLVAMRAAVIIYGGEYKLASKSSLKVVDGPSQIDTTGQFTNFGKLYQSAVDAYNKAKIDYIAGNSIGGRAILTPFTYGNDNIQNSDGRYPW